MSELVRINEGRALAGVVQADEEGRTEGLGNWEFSALPRVGEQITLSGFPSAHVLEITRVEHLPVNAEPETKTGQWARENGPRVLLFARHVRYED
jgi:hypothetical protein